MAISPQILYVYTRHTPRGRFDCVDEVADTKDQRLELWRRYIDGFVAHENNAIYVASIFQSELWGIGRRVLERFILDQEIVYAPHREDFLPGWFSFYFRIPGKTEWSLHMGFYQGNPWKKTSLKWLRELRWAQAERVLMRMYRNPDAPYLDYSPLPLVAEEEILVSYFGEPVREFDPFGKEGK